MKILQVVVTALIAVFVLGLLFSFPVMWLWNWLMPDLFGIQEISVGQALGISFLSNMLFSGSKSSSNSKE